jgi:hypothetical protein
MTIEKKLGEMRARLKKEVGEAFDEVGDAVAEVRRDYAELKAYAEVNPSAVEDMLIDVLQEDARVPKIIPAFAIKWLLRKYVLRK